MSKFVVHSYRPFIGAFHQQNEPGGKNPFEEHLNEFLLRVTRLCLESKD
jgi:hypothetical protein